MRKSKSLETSIIHPHLLRPERRGRAVSENRTGNAATAQASISILLTGIGRQNLFA
jgi:hypothetical protein